MQDLLSQVRFEEISPSNVASLKALNSSIFPISYPEKVYEHCMMCGPVSQLAFLEDKLIGAIACRLENKPNGKARLYIMTLGVLAPYRNEGLGAVLLQRSLELCVEDEAIDEACLHVQTSNEDAVRFYERYGFKVRDTILNYYKRIEPPDAFFLSKDLNSHGDEEKE